MTDPVEPNDDELAAAEAAARRGARAAALAPLRDLGVGQATPPSRNLAEIAASIRDLQTGPDLRDLWPHMQAAAMGLEALERFAGAEIRELEAVGAFDPPAEA